MSTDLPLPDAEARAVSARLVEVLRERIDAAGGCLPFDAFMEAALYEPGLGYYSNGLTPFGARGDFITAPESGSLFARCLARSVAAVLQQLGGGSVLELGAGSAALAVDLLRALQALDALPERYWILERSAAMRALQQDHIARRLPELAARVEWLAAPPPGAFSGVVFGNEVADALPVKRFCWRDGQALELGVAWEERGLVECLRPGDAELQARVAALACAERWESDYRSEFCPALQHWTRELAECLERGLLLLIDYGYGRPEYYHPQRAMGTLMCHYRHQAHADPLWFPGLQDITAFVDFTAIAEAASDAGLRLEGFSSQAQFLLAGGIEAELQDFAEMPIESQLQTAAQVKMLTLPGEMGENVKCICLARGDISRPAAFELADRTYTL